MHKLDHIPGEKSHNKLLFCLFEVTDKNMAFYFHLLENCRYFPMIMFDPFAYFA